MINLRQAVLRTGPACRKKQAAFLSDGGYLPVCCYKEAPYQRA